MESPELPEGIRWILGVLVGAFVGCASAVASWVGMRRDIREATEKVGRHGTALSTQGNRLARLERFESSTVEKLDNLCERADDHRDEFRAFATEVRAFMARTLHTGGGRHGG